ncbi:MAG TPA: hypothetical protein VH251_06625 [Verrucomicrobiae bacterium]|nr:hypothetical protein [Verrucomicrobiae bacterium]
MVGGLEDALLAVGGETDSTLVESILTALLEMTNRRLTGGTFNFGVFGLLLRLVCGVCFAAVALRFNINNETNEPSYWFIKTITNQYEHAASDKNTAFMAVKLELRTPED